jgi:hypothetical protein
MNPDKNVFIFCLNGGVVTTIYRLRGLTAWHTEQALPVQVGDRMVPETIFVAFDGDGEQPSLRMKIEVRQGVPVCSELQLTARPSGREIRPKDLRAVHIDSRVEQAVGLCSYEQPEPGGVIHLSALPPPDAPKHEDARYKDLVADSRNAQRARRGMRQPGPGRPRVPTERLQRVADLYRRHTDGGRPVQVVAEVLGVSERTAARYINKCRSDGLLPPREKAK